MNLLNVKNINHLWSNLLIEELVRNGCEAFFISPGSRSAPLACAAANNPKAKSFIHFDERANAFRAVGYASATKKPAVVITTSGTAVANLMPAVVEASKKKIPLILLTADRPAELRYTGANQTIDQVHIFGSYVRWFFDMPAPDENIKLEFVLTTVDQAFFRSSLAGFNGPVHLNCMFRDPLAPHQAKPFKFQKTSAFTRWTKSNAPYTRYVKTLLNVFDADIAKTALVINKSKSGVIIAGKLASDKERAAVTKLADKLKWPVFADISSGLKFKKDKMVVSYPDLLFRNDSFKKKFKPETVLHFGGRMTSQRWYDFLAESSVRDYIMVLSHPLRNDPTHQVTMRLQTPVFDFCQKVIGKVSAKRGNDIKKYNVLSDKVEGVLQSALKNNTVSEMAIARIIMRETKKDSGLFVSNSLSIRELDFYGGCVDNNLILGANRGASGIDGIIASATGFAEGLGKRCTLVIGDLAYKYDMTSLEMLRAFKHSFTIVLINNSGGGIFSYLSIAEDKKNFKKYFFTEHSDTFELTAQMNGFKYVRPSNLKEFQKTFQASQEDKKVTIIEVMTDTQKDKTLVEKIQKQINNLKF